ncbi:cupin domain-containing protein [Halomonas ramblicola]|uniref:cupin domain-containing protein n=1 Tax=Halomonas ramblicola TaxID=747349 RepID=UPI0025B3A2A4|nr:cupin domain-containing protein [Halomonas ramblicola]MDN3520472.1 cupin domain-containing protein [Halomonas ramblicola]
MPTRGPEENAPRTVIWIDTQAELAPSAPPLAELVSSTPAPEASNRNVFLARNGKLRIGLWECTAYARTETKPAYSELMQILSGSVTLSQPDHAWCAKAGETLVVPAGAECRWTSNETVRKIFCIVG